MGPALALMWSCASVLWPVVQVVNKRNVPVPRPGLPELQEPESWPGLAAGAQGQRALSTHGGSESASLEASQSNGDARERLIPGRSSCGRGSQGQKGSSRGASPPPPPAGWTLGRGAESSLADPLRDGAALPWGSWLVAGTLLPAHCPFSNRQTRLNVGSASIWLQ